MDNVKNDKYYIEKIIKDMSFIVENAGNFTQIQLQNNEILIDSIMFRLIQISENSDKLTEEFKEKYNTIPWRAIKGMRNRIVHEYGNVDFSVVYQTVQNDMPVILEELKKV